MRVTVTVEGDVPEALLAFAAMMRKLDEPLAGRAPTIAAPGAV